jgi:hypothetical protein
MPPPKDETEEQKAIRLAKAKKQAAKSREEKMVEKYKDKVLEKEKKKQVESESEDEDEDEEAPKKPLKVGGRPKRDEDEASASRPAREEPKEPKAPKKKQSKVIIEQSSDDEDVFEDNFTCESNLELLYDKLVKDSKECTYDKMKKAMTFIRDKHNLVNRLNYMFSIIR